MSPEETETPLEFLDSELPLIIPGAKFDNQLLGMAGSDADNYGLPPKDVRYLKRLGLAGRNGAEDHKVKPGEESKPLSFFARLALWAKYRSTLYRFLVDSHGEPEYRRIPGHRRLVSSSDAFCRIVKQDSAIGKRTSNVADPRLKKEFEAQAAAAERAKTK